MISDHDPQFTSHFGKVLIQKLNVNRNLSTAFHLQTYGISEQNNQWVEQYLHLVTLAQPKDWTNWLSLVLAVHNNRKNVTMGLSPNQVLLGYETTLVPTEMPPSNNDLVEDWIKLLMERRRVQAIDTINQSAKADQSVLLQYSKGEQVWLEATNLKFTHQKSKLLPKQYGPFKIIKEVSLVVFQLALPPSWNIHDVFHTSLLTPYHKTTTHGPNFSQPPPDLIDGEEEYEVERIIGHYLYGRNRASQYLVKWKGYPDSDNTWEPAHQVHAPDLVKEFHRQ